MVKSFQPTKSFNSTVILSKKLQLVFIPVWWMSVLQISKFRFWYYANLSELIHFYFPWNHLDFYIRITRKHLLKLHTPIKSHTHILFSFKCSITRHACHFWRRLEIHFINYEAFFPHCIKVLSGFIKYFWQQPEAYSELCQNI